MLTAPNFTVYDNHRMPKQAISVTLSPDNLLWLRGRARAEQLGSLSECLDRLIARARFGDHAPREVRSMKGALAGLAAEPSDHVPSVSPEVWRAWHASWDGLLAGIDTMGPDATRKVRRPRRA